MNKLFILALLAAFVGLISGLENSDVGAIFPMGVLPVRYGIPLEDNCDGACVDAPMQVPSYFQENAHNSAARVAVIVGIIIANIAVAVRNI